MKGERKTKVTLADILDGFCKKQSCADISSTLERKGTSITRTSVYRTIAKYARILYAFTQGLALCSIGTRFRADEIFVKIRGVQHCLFSVTEHGTRFLLSYFMSETKGGSNVTEMLKGGKWRADVSPHVFVTDDLDSYKVGYREEFAPKNPLDPHCVHISNAGINKDKGNSNGQGRYNGTDRAYLKPRRGIKRTDSPVFPLFAVWYNFVRVHTAIGCTPAAEAAGVVIHGRDMDYTHRQCECGRMQGVMYGGIAQPLHMASCRHVFCRRIEGDAPDTVPASSVTTCFPLFAPDAGCKAVILGSGSREESHPTKG